ncbi:hypothetical protein E2C01_024913 [Portunus trituberculatus]|uniref:Uncharacterized protein n=1 Tax=Portunus trituberculatus TaxID=210409 RepID=A0A5B7EDQ3_PORTR|nr:hypothetical protein [Portunus trituberculatus]
MKSKLSTNKKLPSVFMLTETKEEIPRWAKTRRSSPPAEASSSAMKNVLLLLTTPGLALHSDL